MASPKTRRPGGRFDPPRPPPAWARRVGLPGNERRPDRYRSNEQRQGDQNDEGVRFWRAAVATVGFAPLVLAIILVLWAKFGPVTLAAAN